MGIMEIEAESRPLSHVCLYVLMGTFLLCLATNRMTSGSFTKKISYVYVRNLPLNKSGGVPVTATVSLPKSTSAVQTTEAQINPSRNDNEQIILRKRNTDKDLTRNISAILENLLQNYDKSLRPGIRVPLGIIDMGFTGQQTTVTANIFVRSMGPISELDMAYQMDCYFRQIWYDERLRFDGPIPTLSLNIKMLEGIWKPDTYFHNGQDSYVHTITRPNKLLRIFQDGKVLYSMRLIVKAKCPMQLQNFPMDTQTCPLVFGSYAYTKDQVIYTWDPSSSVTFAAGNTLSQFDLVGNNSVNTSVRFKRGDFSVLQVNFNLKRHTGYFLIQVYVPCILIVVLSWVSFWINREATSDRIGLGITTVLTLSTFGLDSRTDLPKVHYATALDWFMVMCFIFVIATLLEFAGVHYFTKLGSGEMPPESDEEEWEDIEVEEVERNSETEDITGYTHVFQMEDRGSVYSSCPAVGTCRYSSCKTAQTQTERHDSCCLQFAQCIIANDEYRQRRRLLCNNETADAVNSVSKIDKASRVVFPLVFGFLNLFYWLSYSRSGSATWMQHHQA